MGGFFSSTKKQDENLETYCLVWLDASVNNSQENIEAQKQLRSSINHLITFENDQQCFQYIQSIPNDDRVVLIVSGRLGQIIVPHIIKFRQITSIYVYCFNKKENEKWAQHYIKIKGVFTQLNELISQIKLDQIQRQKFKIDESLSINIFNSNKGSEGQSTSDLNGQFIHSQLLIECLIRMEYNHNDKNELIEFCKQQYKENNDELKILKEFQDEYQPERSLWWYTRESFLYRLLNKALRVQNIDLLFLFRFFMRHIQQELGNNKCESPLQVYRGQLMSKDEIERLANSVGEFISINSFLSTSLNRQRAKSFLSMADPSNELEKVFFEIDADPRIENIKPFSNITSHSFYPNEQEILFMIGSIFRIIDIKRDDERIWIIKMNLSSYNDHHLQSLFKHMKQILGVGETNLLKFGKVLKDMGKLDEAEKYYLRLLNQLPNDHQNINICYSQLGRVADDRGDYKSSLEWYNKSLDIKLRVLKPNDPNIASVYNNIAIVLKKKDDYEHALESYNKALVIYKRAFGENHSDVALCLNNMGIIYMDQNKCSEALELYQKSLAIRERCLPANHFHLGDSHLNIGNLHYRLGDNDLALKHLHLSLKIYTKSLPPEHPSIGTALKNIGLCHESKKEFEEALSYLTNAAKIYHHSLPSTHPDVMQIEKDIQRVSSKLK